MGLSFPLRFIDAGGFRRFRGHGLEALNAERSRVIETTRKEVSPGNLFSDLNQWMLKILLSRSLSDSLLSAPRGHYENASQLAEAAGVSVMTAFRLVRQLSEEGFLEERSGLRLVRTEGTAGTMVESESLSCSRDSGPVDLKRRKEPFSCCTSILCKPHGGQSSWL